MVFGLWVATIWTINALTNYTLPAHLRPKRPYCASQLSLFLERSCTKACRRFRESAVIGGIHRYSKAGNVWNMAKFYICRAGYKGGLTLTDNSCLIGNRRSRAAKKDCLCRRGKIRLMNKFVNRECLENGTNSTITKKCPCLACTRKLRTRLPIKASDFKKVPSTFVGLEVKCFT